MYIRTLNLTKIFYFSSVDMAFSLGKALLGQEMNFQTHRRSIVAVDNVSLTIRESERIGIIGRNGAGKTTLLQLLAGLAEPTSGIVEVDGHVNCVMTLGVGLREDLSGRENIYIDGETQGKTRSEVNKCIDDIIRFTDIGEFIDLPVRTYSSGMKARLAFSLITHIEPEILIIDETLSVGDAAFSQKATAKIKQICEAGKIVITVSHSMATITEMCNRCLWMDHGKIVMDGDPDTVTKAYLESVRKAREAEMLQRFKKRIGKINLPGFCIDNIQFKDGKGESRLIFEVEEEITIIINVLAQRKIKRADLQITVERMDGILLLQNSANEDGLMLTDIKDDVIVEIELGKMLFGMGMYEVCVSLFEILPNGIKEKLAQSTTMLKIDNENYRYDYPVFWAPGEWHVETVEGIENT